MTDTTTLAPTDAELHDLADRCTPNTETGSLNYRAFARAVLAKWGAPATASGEDVSPFGYFRAEPFGWTDCAESDEGAKPLYEKPQAHSDLHAAAQALVDRWDTPKWKDADHTGAFIQRLREALAAPPAQEARVPLLPNQRSLIALTADSISDAIDMTEIAHGITAAQKEAP